DERASGWQVPGCRAVVLGAGGAARSAVYMLKQRGVEVDIVNRTLPRAQELAARFSARAHGTDALARLLPAADVLVNCTSLGMAGKSALDIDLAPLKRSAGVFDVIYVPPETALLKTARGRRHRPGEGLRMVLHHAGHGCRQR